MKDSIGHGGVIESISGNHIRVHIVQTAACAGCKAKELCTSSETKDKYVDVYDSDASRWTVGEKVKVCASLSMGKSAVKLAFGVPIVIMVASLMIAKLMLHMPDSWAALLMFVPVAIYFLVMYCLRDKLARKFVMWLEKA